MIGADLLSRDGGGPATAWTASLATEGSHPTVARVPAPRTPEARRAFPEPDATPPFRAGNIALGSKAVGLIAPHVPPAAAPTPGRRARPLSVREGSSCAVLYLPAMRRRTAAVIVATPTSSSPSSSCGACLRAPRAPSSSVCADGPRTSPRGCPQECPSSCH